MKRLIFILSFLLISWSAFSQAVTQTGFVGKFSFQSFSAGGSSDVTGTLDAFSDQTNQYFASNIQVGDVIWDNQGGRWEVMAVNSANLLQADVDLRSVNGAGGTPFGVGYVSRETPNMGLSLFVPDNNIGISQQLKSRIESHNMLLIDQYVAANQDSVFTGATAADTSTVSDPTIGDVLVAENGDVGYFDGESWVISSGGGSGTWLKPEWEAGDVVIEAPSSNTLTVESGSLNTVLSAEKIAQNAGGPETELTAGSIKLSHPALSWSAQMTYNGYLRLINPSGTLTVSPGSIIGEGITDVQLGSYYFDTDQDTTGTIGYFLGHDTDGQIRLLPGGGGSDGNGIYSGSGTVPDETEATITNRFNFIGSTKLDADPPSGQVNAGMQSFEGGIMSVNSTIEEPDSLFSWGWKSAASFGPAGQISEFSFNPYGGTFHKKLFNFFGNETRSIHQDNAYGIYDFFGSGTDSAYYHRQHNELMYKIFSSGDSVKYHFDFDKLDFDFSSGNNRFLLTRDQNISLTATTGFTATTTSGILGLTHTGSSGQLIVQSQDERATFQGEDTRINGDTIITLNAAAGNPELTLKDSLITVGYLADDNAPVKLLGLNANREIVQTDTLIQASNGINDADPSASMDFELGGPLERNTTIIGENKRLEMDSLNRFYVQNTQGSILMETDTLGDRKAKHSISVSNNYIQNFNYATDQMAKVEVNQSGEVILTASNLAGSVQTQLIMEKEYFKLEGVPVYADDAAADGDAGLPAGALYQVTGDRGLRIKP